METLESDAVGKTEVEQNQIRFSGVQHRNAVSDTADTRHDARALSPLEGLLDEADVASIRLGQGVEITIDAFPDETGRGMVTKIDPQAVTEQNITTVLVTVEVENPDDPAQHLSRFETNAPFDTVLEFYTAEFGWTRALEEAVNPPAGIAVGASQQGVTGMRARWYALSNDGEGNSLKVDVTIQSPFFDPDGSFHPETTLIALSHLR